MTKILYLSGSQIPSKSANSVHVMKMCQALANEGCTVKLTGMGTSKEDLYKFYDVAAKFKTAVSSPQRNNILRFFAYNWLCFKEIAQSRNTVVYLRYFYPLLWCIIFRKKVIVEFHGISHNRFIKWLINILLRSEKLVTAVFITEKLLLEYQKMFKLEQERCLILSDCADKVDVPENGTNRKNIGYVGHLYGGRGIEIIIEVAVLLQNYTFHIIGGHPGDVEKYRAISPTNIKYYGFKTQAELKEVYKHFSIALAPYQEKVSIEKKGADNARWMSPMKIFEYMANKKVIIMSDLPALREIGLHTKDFLMVDAKDSSQWKKAIETLNNDSDLFDDIREHSYKTFLAKYTWSSRAKRITDAISLKK
ncbi:glycosyltransferase family 4 protein [Chryseobacterium salipaludis]|uniref:glycosyltransferase family 4 protein n=1 Tax=Chryseobacterium TaxID=59732 RepID=UPI001FF22623|nr:MULTISPECIES: glycosyltransferase family 4 protein [Chryseobacterium]MCJ8498593.1 glycosyltransferase family 4 protein [Chryseobacterium salipaludis]MCX3297757.1 glycosyltransferase family 4 protein [Planobacterium sp. JC490]